MVHNQILESQPTIKEKEKNKGNIVAAKEVHLSFRNPIDTLTWSGSPPGAVVVSPRTVVTRIVLGWH